MLLDELKLSETTKLIEFKSLKKMLAGDQDQDPDKKRSQSTRRNKSVYTGMYRKVIEEIDRDELPEY